MTQTRDKSLQWPTLRSGGYRDSKVAEPLWGVHWLRNEYYVVNEMTRDHTVIYLT